MRTVECGRPLLEGRWARAREFWDQAQLTEDFAAEPLDVAASFVTSCVHAGIAAADVICCARLGKHARGGGHDDAVQLVSQADPEAANALRRLLRMKTKAAYTADAISRADLTATRRATEALMERAAAAV